MASEQVIMNQENAQQDFSIWEFVTCAVCQIAFLPNGAPNPTIPFWITECGHVLCNSHLSADQSCSSCNAKGIELMPLQKEMPPPFSDWFCSLPFKLDALAQTAKFQHERLTSAARYYKSRYLQYRAICVQKHNEVKSLKKELEELRAESSRALDRAGQVRQEPSSYMNANGKRPLTSNHLSTSSPRSIHTPLGPPRITLPPDADPPPSLSRLNGNDDVNVNPHLRRQSQTYNNPPGSSHFNLTYAYKKPQMVQMQQQLPQVSPNHPQEGRFDSRHMPPPPAPGQFRRLPEQYRDHETQRLPTPMGDFQARFTEDQGLPNKHVSGVISSQYIRQNQSQGPRRFIPPATTPVGPTVKNHMNASMQSVPSTPNDSIRRFMPSTPSMAEGRRFIISGAKTSAGGTWAPNHRSGF